MKLFRVFVAVLVLAGMVGVAGYGAYELDSRPIVSVRVAGDLLHIDQSELQAAMAEHISVSLYRVDVDAIRGATLILPWVKDTSVRRVWPDSLHLAVIEREPVARWFEGGLVGTSGEVFYPTSVSAFSHLPLLEGPADSSGQVLQKYLALQSRLRPLGWAITHLILNRRGAWHAELDGRILVVLGREPNIEAVERFVDAFESVLAPRVDELVHADLRYTNGFAVRWRNLKDRESQGKERQG